MVTLRSLLYFIAMLLTILVFGLLISVGALLGMPLARRSTLAGYWGLSNLKLLKWICGLDCRVEGRENIPTQACVIMSKHQSTWETIALRWLLPHNQAWVLKKELMRVPVFGWALAADRAIAIDRDAGRKAVKQLIEQGIQRLEEGRHVIIFPEGTRVAPGEHRKYAIGGALLAQKSGRPVLPIAHNAGVFWRRRGLQKLPGTIQVVIGPPIGSEGKSAAAINREVEAWIEGQMEKLPKHPSGPRRN
ncbi:MAG TPA: 1-acyl-sn-glycerol-3-phosphate acyltransferase [Sedimenticola sp.]|nr:1-acyl-sn-glycerol-3-phosphate acyltransferase [Sedimenticola sp.]